MIGLFLVLLLLAAIASCQEVSTAVHCLSSINGLSVLTSSSPQFHLAKLPFNLRLSPNPDIVVTPSSAEEIQSIVKCAAKSNLTVSARSGGHSYASYGLAGDVVVDLSKLKGLAVATDGRAVVQTGNLLGDLATGIFKQGGRALPHGSCPYVGVGGHTLYGGFGFFGRIGGLLVDRVVSADVVLANGTNVTASNTSNTDLFWAIRGGGPSFGIVTAWTYATLEAPSTTVNFIIHFNVLTVDEVIDAYVAWQSFATTAPDELALAAVLLPADGATVTLLFQGDYYGSEGEFQKVIAPLIKVLPRNANLTSKALGWIDGLIADDGPLSTSAPDIHDTFFAKSLVTTSPSSRESIASWIKYLVDEGDKSDTDWFVQVDLFGGAISRVGADATAFAQRSAFLVYQLYASSQTASPPFPKDGISFVDNMLAALEPNPQGAYPNYMDPTLSDSEWQRLYFNDHVARLQKIKKDVDPYDVFRLREGF